MKRLSKEIFGDGDERDRADYMLRYAKLFSKGDFYGAGAIERSLSTRTGEDPIVWP